MSAFAPEEGQFITFVPEFYIPSGTSDERSWPQTAPFVGVVTKAYSVAMARVESLSGDVATWAFGDKFAVVPK